MVLDVVFPQVFCEQAKEKHSSVESFQWYVDVMVGQMTHAHETREQDLQSKIHELKATVKDITQKNENLSSAYRYVEFYKLNLVYCYSNAKARDNRHFVVIIINKFLLLNKDIEIILLIIITQIVKAEDCLAEWLIGMSVTKVKISYFHSQGVPH